MGFFFLNTRTAVIATRRRSIRDRAPFLYCSGKLGYGSLQCHIPRGGERRATSPAHFCYAARRLCQRAAATLKISAAVCLRLDDNCLCFVCFLDESRGRKSDLISGASAHFSKIPATTLKGIYSIPRKGRSVRTWTLERI